MLELYAKYKLKNGDTGRVVEILGSGETCIFEIDKKGLQDRVITVMQEEIEKIIEE